MNNETGVLKGQCESCLEEKPYIIADEFHGNYYKGCIRLLIAAQKENLQLIREQKALERELKNK